MGPSLAGRCCVVLCCVVLVLSSRHTTSVTPGSSYHIDGGSSLSRRGGLHPLGMLSASAAVVEDNADVDRLFGLVDASDDEVSASSFSSVLSTSTAYSNVDPSPARGSCEQETPPTVVTVDPLDVHLEQTRAYHRKRRREAIDTAVGESCVARQRMLTPPAVLISTVKHVHPLFAIKQQPVRSTTRLPSATPPPPPSPPPIAAGSSSSPPRLLNEAQLHYVLNPAPYYSRQGVQDFDQVMSTNHVAAYVDLTAVAESADYIRVPSFSLGDGGVHGPHISDHSVHKSRHDGYWEERLRKLEAQHPREQYYNSLPTFTADSSTTPTTHASSTAASASHPPIFAGCLMYINGRTEGASELSAHSLSALIRLHGGRTSPLMSRTHTTHVIAINLTLSKHRKEMAQTAGMGKSRGRVQVVKPEWVRECIRQGKLLNEVQWRVVKDVQQRELPWTAAGSDESEKSSNATSE